MTMQPKHIELFIRSDGVVVAQCRTETAGRLDDPVSLHVGGEIWAQFQSDWGAAQLAQIADLTSARDQLTTDLQALTAERDQLQQQLEQATATLADLQEQHSTYAFERAALQAEIDRLTALVPPPATDYQVSRSEFLERLQAADEQIMFDIWKSDSPQAIMAVVALFTYDGLVDLRPNSRTHQMLQSLIPIGVITEEQVQSLLVEG